MWKIIIIIWFWLTLHLFSSFLTPSFKKHIKLDLILQVSKTKTKLAYAKIKASFIHVCERSNAVGPDFNMTRSKGENQACDSGTFSVSPLPNSAFHSSTWILHSLVSSVLPCQLFLSLSKDANPELGNPEKRATSLSRSALFSPKGL